MSEGDGVGPGVEACAREMSVAAGRSGRPQVRLRKTAGWTEARRQLFLDHLAATCNVTASATAAGLYWSGAYAWRRKDPEFAAQWQAALETGYARLEAMLVERAAGGGVAEPDGGAGAAGTVAVGDAEAAEPVTPDPAKMDTGLALSLLQMHRARMVRGTRGRTKPVQRASKKETVEAIVRQLRVLRRRLEAEEKK